MDVSLQVREKKRERMKSIRSSPTRINIFSITTIIRKIMIEKFNKKKILKKFSDKMKTDIRNYCRFIRNKLDVSLKIRARTLE